MLEKCLVMIYNNRYCMSYSERRFLQRCCMCKLYLHLTHELLSARLPRILTKNIRTYLLFFLIYLS
jgi:hypothetical protein